MEEFSCPMVRDFRLEPAVLSAHRENMVPYGKRFTFEVICFLYPYRYFCILWVEISIRSLLFYLPIRHLETRLGINDNPYPMKSYEFNLDVGEDCGTDWNMLRK